MFDRYIGIDYSGAQTSTDQLDGLAVACALGGAAPVIEGPLSDGFDIRTREGIAGWLVQRLSQSDIRTLVGIDHGFSFPNCYFQRYNHLLGMSWVDFLDDFQHHWPTDRNRVTVNAMCAQNRGRYMGLREGEHRWGNSDWFRLTDPRGLLRFLISTPWPEMWRIPRTPGYRGCVTSANS